MRKTTPHWIRHTHLFDDPDYECSVCGTCFADTNPTCPVCGSWMQGMNDPQDWVDEAEELDYLLGDE